MKTARTFVIPALLALAALAPRPADAQAVASLVPMPRAQFFSASGVPLAGGCVWTYAAGSSTPLNTYKNAAGAANANPVVLDSAGRADIWLGAGSAYKISVSAKTSAGCVGATTPLYTADNVIDQGFSLVRQLQNGSLAIGLRGLPITGTGGGVGVGNAMLSATVDGLYVSVNGAAPVLLSGGGGTGGGAAAGPATSVQYNGGGTPAALAGSANLKWDNGGRILVICGAPATGCVNTSGVEAPTFSSSAAPGDPAFETASSTFHINGSGDGFFQGLNVTATFNSLATGPTSAVQQATGTFKITGAGDAGFQTVGIGLHATPTTGLPGGVNVGSATLSATTAGLYLSLNGAPPALITGGGGSGTPGAPATSVQFNNAGTFAGSSNFAWDAGGNVLHICTPPGTGCVNTSGVEATTFSSNAATGDPAFETAASTFHINGDGNGFFQGLNVTATFNSLATGATSAIQQSSGTFRITGAGDGLFQSVGMGLHASPITGAGGGVGVGEARLSATTAGLYISLNGAAPVLVGGGGSGTPGAPSTSIQYNNAGTFAGSASLTWDNPNSVLNAPVFSCTTTTAANCFKTSSGNASITGNGAISGQLFAATGSFFSQAVGTAQAFLAAGLAINGQGDGVFRSLAVAGGSYGLNSTGQLTVSSCIGCVGSAAGANTQVQFNNGGVFGASANLTWSGGVLTVGGGNLTGMNANTFTANASGAMGFQTANNSWQVDASGNSSQTGQLSISGGATGASFNMLSNTGTFRTMNYYSGGSVRWQMGIESGAESGGNAGANYSWNRFSDGGSLIDTPLRIYRADGVLRIYDGWTVGAGNSYGLTTAGALTVASCTGCAAGGGVTSLTSSGNGITFSAATGAVTASLTQDLRTVGSPTFQSVTSSSFFSCQITGLATCITSGSGTFSINGNGTFLGQSIATGANNGTLATAGQGATISNSGAAIGMVVYDNTGHCNIGTGSFVCSSDERLKKNIAPIGDALKAVTALRPVTFDWRGNGEHGLGFIAQEVQRVLPGLVTTDKGGYLELSEINMIPYLVRSIQQLQAEVDALRSRSGVAALYDQLSK